MKTKVFVIGVISFLIVMWTTVFTVHNVEEWAKLPVCLSGFVGGICVGFFMVKGMK